MMPGTALALLFSCWITRDENMQPSGKDSKGGLPFDSGRTDKPETPAVGPALPCDCCEEGYVALGKTLSSLIREEVQRILQSQSSFREEMTADEEDLRDIIRSQEEKIGCLERIIADLKTMLQSPTSNGRGEFEDIDLSHSNSSGTTHPHSQMKS